MISPTGQGIRNDEEGNGHFLAPRGNRLHHGIDFKCWRGQLVLAPFDMKIVRYSYPYHDQILSGIAFESGGMEGKMWYFTPYREKIGYPVKEGQYIGIAQDVKAYHGDKMDDHIHLEIMTKSNKGMVYIDPMIFLKEVKHGA